MTSRSRGRARLETRDGTGRPGARLGEFEVESPPAASPGPSDVTSKIAEHDYELQSRWLVGVQVWGGGVRTFANNPRREFSQKEPCTERRKTSRKRRHTTEGRPQAQGAGGTTGEGRDGE